MNHVSSTDFILVSFKSNRFTEEKTGSDSDWPISFGKIYFIGNSDVGDKNWWQFPVDAQIYVAPEKLYVALILFIHSKCKEGYPGKVYVGDISSWWYDRRVGDMI